MKRFLSILASLALLAILASDGLTQRAVRVQPRTFSGAEKRVALVIGNSAYGRMGRLVNPANDAADMARTLRGLGFQVTHKQDLDRRGMEEALDDFSAQAQGSAVALFYFAGHGVQVDRVNYLVPLRSRIRKQLDAKYEALPANKVVDMMKAGGARASIVILDACRNNPLPKTGRSASGGLATMQAGTGTLIAFAAGPGQEADENSGGRNGLYTQELLKNMKTPGISIVEVFQRTRNEVYRRSRRKQTPQDWNQLVGNIYLAGTGSAPIAKTQPLTAPQPRQSIDAEEEFWGDVKNSKVVADLEDYLKEFPAGRFARLARVKIRRLKRADTRRRARFADEKNKSREAEKRRVARLVTLNRANTGTIPFRPPPKTSGNIPFKGPPKISGNIPFKGPPKFSGNIPFKGPPKTAAIRGDGNSRTWRDPVTGMEFVKVPGGSFEMGCHANAGECDSNEKTVRTVRLDGFWMGKHEVTVGQFKKFVNDSGYTTEAEKSKVCWIYDGKWKQKPGTSWRNPGFQQGGNHPVTCVTWKDSQAFARWLSGKSGENFRLPSEAEWEYSCRAGGKPIKFQWGNQDVGSGEARANFADKNANFGWSAQGVNDGYAHTAPVGRFAPNALGLHDMSGNVWEWTADKYTKDYGMVGTDNPIYEGSGGYRVYRGGGWSNASRYLRCSNRLFNVPSFRNYRLGFRLVRIR